MAVGNQQWQDLAAVNGVRLGVAKAGIKYPNRADVAVVLLDEGSKVAGVFTQNAFAAAPVMVCRSHLLRSNKQRAFVINSGNANACTGEEGMLDARGSCAQLAQLLSIEAEQVLPFSTGVIGERLPFDKLVSVLPKAVSNATERQWCEFAQAIMTTDTRPKGASASFQWAGETIRVSGVAKGSGMINPNMATMLAFVATEMTIADEILADISLRAAQNSFNRITIDGDTSTNDACMLIATGKSQCDLRDSHDPLYQLVLSAVTQVYQSLAKQIVKDGEGASKFVEIAVEGGKTTDESLRVAYAIAHSPLVKTALFASDPNWGRIVAAIGYADIESLDANEVKVWFDDTLVVENGSMADQYSEALGQSVLNKESFCIRVDLGRGKSNREVLWTTDLSHEYIRINAEYRS